MCTNYFKAEEEFKDLDLRIEKLSESQGLNSIIYEVYLGNEKTDFILKQFKPMGSEENPPQVEAMLQMYAGKHGFAPKVYAFNEHAMLIERCYKNLHIEKAHLPWGVRYDAVNHKRYNLLYAALCESSLDILDITRRMYDAIGLYNCDPNIDNYMTLKDGTLVQIDYGRNAFRSEDMFQKFVAELDAGQFMDVEMLRRALLRVEEPMCPPYFYWYGVYYAGDNIDRFKAYTEEQWSDEMKRLLDEKDIVKAKLDDQIRKHREARALARSTPKHKEKKSMFKHFVQDT